MKEPNRDLYREAARRAERKLGFLVHLCIYVLVNGALLALNYSQHAGVPWAAAPLLGWGIGLLFHGLSVFMRTTSAAWKRRMIDHELKKLSPDA
ncbi:MAG: hypothetical protein K0S28_1292 [Paucimonas sp.]|jgi:hypothetical protein|nr:hypothetical protein [Paucimonas sp.]